MDGFGSPSPAQCPCGRRTSIRSCCAMLVPHRFMQDGAFSRRTTDFVETSMSSLWVVVNPPSTVFTEVAVAHASSSENGVLALAKVLAFHKRVRSSLTIVSALFSSSSERNTAAFEHTAKTEYGRGGNHAFGCRSDAHQHVKRAVLFGSPYGSRYIAITQEVKLCTRVPNVLEEVMVALAVKGHDAHLTRLAIKHVHGLLDVVSHAAVRETCSSESAGPVANLSM